MYEQRLDADGYDVHIAGDGAAGLRMAAELRPDLIYLDLRLPKMDGFQVMTHLRATPQLASIPVIILTNYSEPELRMRGLDLGALEVLMKVKTSPSRLLDLTDDFFRATNSARGAGASAVARRDRQRSA